MADPKLGDVLVVVIVVAVVAVAACLYAYWRARSRAATLSGRLEQTEEALDSVEHRLQEAGQENEQLTKERDDALERVQRAKRDAAEVAKRLAESTAAREDVEARLASVEQERAAAHGTQSLDPDLLWGMTLARLDRLWRVSVAPGTAEDSPLVSTDAALRTALEIQVAAAREESGALIDLAYSGDIDVESASAAMACVVVEELIAGVVALDEEARLSVTVGDAIDIEVVAEGDDGTGVEIPGPLDLQVEPGRFRVARSAATAGRAHAGFSALG